VLASFGRARQLENRAWPWPGAWSSASGRRTRRTFFSEEAGLFTGWSPLAVELRLAQELQEGRIPS
jgi:hypothetical protein